MSELISRVAGEKPGEAVPIDDRPPERRAAPSSVPAAGMQSYDCVDVCSDASFPASDPPSWWSGR
ncbi:MAG TPA: hypothetical protein VGJ70_02440 [Solirubrobacteraceae bacterium]